MKSDRMKALQISSELVDYLLQNNMDHINMVMELEEHYFTIEVSVPTEQPPEDLEVLAEALKGPRQPEMEEYYDALIGCEYRDEGYHMLGALVDESDVRFQYGQLTIKVRRNGHFTY